MAAILALVLVTASLALVACSAARANPVAADPAPAGQAEFKVVGLGVNPSQVGPGEKVVINAKIVNSGDVDGTYNAQLKVNGVVEAVGDIDIPAGGSREVTFNTSKNLFSPIRLASIKWPGNSTWSHRRRRPIRLWPGRIRLLPNPAAARHRQLPAQAHHPSVRSQVQAVAEAEGKAPSPPRGGVAAASKYC